MDIDGEACRAYGALTEGVHVAGYTVERAQNQLEWLLTDKRWQRLGIEFKDVNAFLDSIKLKNLRVAAEQRKKIADLIRDQQPEVSNRAIGRMLGVDESTIRADRAGNPAPEQLDASDPPTHALPFAGNPAPPRPDPAAQRGQPARIGPDFWPTPDSLVRAFIRYVLPDLPPGPIWECAAGDGRLAKAIAQAGRRVIATDLYPQDGRAPVDFIRPDPPANTEGSIAVTNPPYNRSEEFLASGLDLLDAGWIRGLVLLLRHDHLMAASRTEIFNRAVREVHCNWRPIWIDDSDGNPRWSFHWLIWHPGTRCPPLYLDETSVQLEEAA